MQEKIYELVLNGDEVTWQSILYELVKKEGMDPWDIDVSSITKRYIDTIRKLKELDFRVSGKVVLAAAILLKIKSNRLVGEDLMELDRLIAGPEQEGALFDDVGVLESAGIENLDEKPTLMPRVPQPRKRKVSIYDLVEALEKALEVKQRRVFNSIPPLNVYTSKKTRDITHVIREVYGKIKNFLFLNNQQKVMFSQLVNSGSREDKIYTFIPLLHLNFQRKIDLEQKVPFGDIEVTMYSTKKEVDNELEAKG